EELEEIEPIEGAVSDGEDDELPVIEVDDDAGSLEPWDEGGWADSEDLEEERRDDDALKEGDDRLAEVAEDSSRLTPPTVTPLELEERELGETDNVVFPFSESESLESMEMTPLEALEASTSEKSAQLAAEPIGETEEVVELQPEEVEEVEEIEEAAEWGEVEELEAQEVEELEDEEELEDLGELEPEQADTASPVPGEIVPLEIEELSGTGTERQEDEFEELEEEETAAELEDAPEGDVEAVQNSTASIFFTGFSFGERFSNRGDTAVSDGSSDGSRRTTEVELIRGVEYIRIEPATSTTAYELMGYEDLMQLLFAHSTIISEEEGLAEIALAAYEEVEERTLLDRRLKELVGDVVHKYLDPEGVSQLFGGIDGIFGEEEERGEPSDRREEGPERLGERRVHAAFTKDGLDIDRFVRRRDDRTGRLYRTLIELTRSWRARTCALLERTATGYKVSVTLGLDEQWREALSLDNTANLSREVLSRRMVLQTRLPLDRYIDFADTIRGGDVSGVQQTFFIPARHNNTESYLMVGYDAQIASIENFVERFINAGGRR
ncbi:MAG: hypothetical protein ACLFP6_01710, partial [Spirochaetaceae bacterium]